MGRRLERHPATRPGSSLYRCFEVVSRLRVARNFVLATVARYLPWFELKNALYRLMGIRIGRRVAFSLMAMVDVVFPEQISVGDDSVIGYNTLILTHEFLVHEWRRGRVEIGERVLIGANCTVLPGIRIGDDAVVAAHSLVNRDVEAGAVVGGVPARPIERDEEHVFNCTRR